MILTLKSQAAVDYCNKLCQQDGIEPAFQLGDTIYSDDSPNLFDQLTLKFGPYDVQVNSWNTDN